MRIDGRVEPSPNEALVLAKEPSCDEAMALVIDAWQKLDADRPRRQVQLEKHTATISDGIPFAALDAWARRHRLDDEHFLLISDVIQFLDGERSERVWNELTAKG